MPQLTPELVDLCARFAWNRSLREQQREETIRSEISDGIRRASGMAMAVNSLVVGTVCQSNRQACTELRGNLLENPHAPFDHEVAARLREQFEYRTRWGRFCAATKGGPVLGRYPHRQLFQALTAGATPHPVRCECAVCVRLFGALQQ